MKIIVIGSKGFIGRHAYEYFRNLGNEAWGCDVVVDYTDKNYYLVDATNSNFHDIFEQQRFDVCLNCSGAASVPDSFNNPARDFALNVHNVVNLLDAIRKYTPSCRFINMSSAAVYGNPQFLPIDEQHPLNPISPYGAHKKIAEEIVEMYFKYFQVRAVNLRIFSAYGPGLKKQLIWDIAQKVRLRQSLTFFGTGHESRDFIYVEDIIRAIAYVIENGTFQGESINIANGFEISTKEVVSTFLNCYDVSAKYEFDGKVRIGDPVNWCANIEKLKKMGYHPEYSFYHGISKVVKWIKESE